MQQHAESMGQRRPRGTETERSQKDGEEKEGRGRTWEVLLTPLLGHEDVFLLESLALYEFLKSFHGLWVSLRVSPCGEVGQVSCAVVMRTLQGTSDQGQEHQPALGLST